jgi:glycosyltransferase involved in cell wall biosynthesis
VSDVDLATYYRMADVYVSLSEHEGFCVPLLEAMAADVPVLAYASTAVPDTLGGAGVQFAPKDLEWAAELLGELAFNDGLRTRRSSPGSADRLKLTSATRVSVAIAGRAVGGPGPPRPGRHPAPGRLPL